MDAGPLIPPAPNWRLADPVAGQTQGLVATGFPRLATGRALFLEFRWPDETPVAGWLTRLCAVAPITSSPAPADASPQQRAAALAFTATGLARLGLSRETLLSFSRPFYEGMFQEDRLRRLGDRRLGQWLPTVIDNGPLWSANTPIAPLPRRPGAFDVPPVAAPAQQTTTGMTVHALLLLYAAGEAEADAWATEVEAKLTPDGIAIVRRLELLLDVGKSFNREHFGFADGLSQPLPYGVNDEAPLVRINGQPATQDPVQGVPLGEFLLGHINGHGEPAPGPVVAETPANAAAALHLPRFEQAPGFRDLGINGSYLVVRELNQYFAAFWQSMAANAAAMGQTADWLAARVVGRDADGHLLGPDDTVLPACSDGSPDSSFSFYDRDALATGCPAGSHVRRAFPRDALAPNPNDKPTLLQAANNHRILRRGRKFGPATTSRDADDGAHRGLLFMCLNTDIERQFEFVQQTWLLNSNFATLFEETDPLVGPAGRMTIRGPGLRRTATVDTFIRMAGGDYFFLPSLPALQFLAAL